MIIFFDSSWMILKILESGGGLRIKYVFLIFRKP